MPLDEADAAFIWDMLRAARKAREIVHAMDFEQYQEDELRKLAIERLIEIIGEAAHSVSREFRDANPEIPWPKIIGQRHILAHEYGRVNHELLWMVVTERLAPLIDQLEALLKQPPSPGAAP